MSAKFKKPLIPFHKVMYFEKELTYVQEVLESRKPKGNGVFTKKCHQFFEQNYGMKNAFLTTSCTTALEMAALLMELKPRDEIIIPSYTYITSASSFKLHGAKIVFVDLLKNSPHLDPEKLKEVITKNTKAILAVHYGGVGANMDQIMRIAKEHNIIVIEDVAHGIDAYYKGKPLGSIGHMSAFSFHQTKNISSGHGGMLIINDERFLKKANEVWNKGSNKASFDKGEVNFYSWTALGSSFYPAEIVAAALYGQLVNLKEVTEKRVEQWNYYNEHIIDNANKVELQQGNNQNSNGHIFYLKLPDIKQRNQFIEYLKNEGIYAYTHFRCLHKSTFINSDENLVNAQKWEDCLVRLPLFHELTEIDQERIVSTINTYFENK